MTNDEITWAAGSNPSAQSDANSTPLPGARHAQALAPHPRSRVGRTSSRLGRACPVTPFTLNTGARASRPAAKFPRAASPAGAPVWPFLPARRRGNAGRARSLRVQVMTRGAGSEPAPFLQPM